MSSWHKIDGPDDLPPGPVFEETITPGVYVAEIENPGPGEDVCYITTEEQGYNNGHRTACGGWTDAFVGYLKIKAQYCPYCGKRVEGSES